MVGRLLNSPIVLLVVASHVVAGGLTTGMAVYVSRNYWSKPIGRAFVLLVTATSVWIVGSLARLFTTSIDQFVLVTTFKYIGAVLVPVLVLVFALLYNGMNWWIRRDLIGVLLALPALTLVVIATTETHGLFYSSYGQTTVGPLAVLSITQVGPWYWLFAVYSWVILAVASIIIVYAGFSRSHFYRIQSAVVLPAILVSWVVNLAYAIFGWPHVAVDPTPIGFAVATCLLAVGIFSTRLIDITPAARSVVLSVIKEAVMIIDEDDRVVEYNDHVRPLLSQDRATGEPAAQVLPASVVQPTESDQSTIKLTVDSRRRYYRRRQVPIGPGGNRGRVIVLTDITAETEAEQQITQAHRKLRQVLDLIPDPIFAKNLDDEVLLSNEANARLHGMTAEEFEGKREREIEPDVQNIDDFDTYRQREREVVERNEQRTLEEELRTPDGEIRVFKTTRIPFETAGGDEDAVLGYARDVTDLKEYEQRIERANEELELLNRILRHDVQNDARVALRFADELEAHVDGEGVELVEGIKRRNDHVIDLTRTLRNLMEVRLGGEGDFVPVRIDEVLESEVGKIADTYPQADISLDGTPPEVSVLADQMLSTVFRNLLENAVEHNDGDPTVTVGAEENEETVVARIADDGPGIPESQRDTIFGKGEHGLQSKGTGVGLYLVAVLVDEYGGEIYIEDNQPEGSVFVVELQKA